MRAGSALAEQYPAAVGHLLAVAHSWLAPPGKSPSSGTDADELVRVFWERYRPEAVLGRSAAEHRRFPCWRVDSPTPATPSPTSANASPAPPRPGIPSCCGRNWGRGPTGHRPSAIGHRPPATATAHRPPPTAYRPSAIGHRQGLGRLLVPSRVASGAERYRETVPTTAPRRGLTTRAVQRGRRRSGRRRPTTADEHPASRRGDRRMRPPFQKPDGPPLRRRRGVASLAALRFSARGQVPIAARVVEPPPYPSTFGGGRRGRSLAQEGSKRL